MGELAFFSATEQAALVRRGEVSPVTLVEAYLERIERLDPELGAYVTVTGEQAIEQARKAEEAARLADQLPPFHGVPIPIKDLSSTAGIRTTFSCRALADFVPPVDLAVVRRLKEAGFIVLGKTNTPEFGTIPVTESDLNGACRNPWDTARTPGGSSGGAAVAVAAGLCPVAHGSDGGGSIRIPASCCGLYGLKPSRGRVSSAPFNALEGLGTSGPITRTVRDAAALLDAMSGYEPGDPYWLDRPVRPFVDEAGQPPGRLRVAVTSAPPMEADVDPQCAAAVDDAAALLSELGHEVEEAAPDWAEAELLEIFRLVWQTIPAIFAVDPAALTAFNRALLEEALQTPSTAYVGAATRLQLLARRVVPFWQNYDLVLTPTLALPPVPIGWMFETDEPKEQFDRGAAFTPFTPVVNVTGQPAASVPLHWSDDGLPIGVQLIARPAGEALLLRVSAQLEEARPWAGRRPAIS